MSLQLSTNNRLQRSDYNYFVERPEGIVAYNARTGHFALLTSDLAMRLQSDCSLADIEEVESLVEMGFLHYGDERDHIGLDYTKASLSQKHLGLTIAPTMGCNYHCDYCYQNEYRNSRIMSPDTQVATLRYIEWLVSQGKTSASCTWYGGEPLLAKSIVLNMAMHLNILMEKYNVALDRMSMITNGSLLDSDTTSQLFDVGIRRVQVSFDSYYDDGKTKRGVVLANEEPSLILSNVLAASRLLSVSIRINISQDNESDLDRILETLDFYNLKSFAYLARVSDEDGESNYKTSPQGERQAYSGSLPIIQQGAQPLTRFRFAGIEDSKWSSMDDTVAMETMLGRLTPRRHFCSATSGKLFVFDPDGNISRCWHSAGVPSEAMGNVNDGTPDAESSDVAKVWRNYSPFFYPACANCKVLPLCMGGCSHARVFMNARKPPCETIKFQIQNTVERVGRALDLSAPLPQPNSKRTSNCDC
ncbi:radical SAM protein [Bremerella sp. JC770]|uniref:radical SAM/SPASM domain-containing protein n=1 Tax=Bremerella sp. JC770 TaxID=3232137 RepID=UPI003458018E